MLLAQNLTKVLQSSHSKVYKRGLFNWSKNVTIYPPSPSEITSNNRLFPSYIASSNELSDILLDKDPLLLNFTYQGDKKCNKLTKELFNILAYKENCPFNTEARRFSLANVACEYLDKDVMLTYGINQVPTVLCLYHQIPIDRYKPGNLEGEFKNKELLIWLQSIQNKL